MKDKSKILLIVVILLIAGLIAYISYGIIKGKQNPIVTMEVAYVDAEGNAKTGIVKMELYPEVAPESVANFITLANNGFYNGLTFHRIEDNFVVQGGDKKGDGSGSGKLSYLDKSVQEGSDGDYTYSIKGEFAANGVNNNLKFEKGVVGVARSDYSSLGLTEESYNSGSTQFFIVTSENKAAVNSLNQNYAAFGKVIEGYEFVEEINKLYAGKDTKTTTTESAAEGEEQKVEKDIPKMNYVNVETFGVKYKAPNAINFDSTLQKISQYQSFYSQLNQQQTSGETAATSE